MKAIHFLTIVLAAILMAACDEHQEVVDLTLRVGNVYRTDGTIVPPQHHKAQGDEAPMAVGVLVAVGGQDDNYSALVMALEDLDDTYWFSGKSSETDVMTDLESFNGRENTSTLLFEYSEDKELDPMGAVMAGAYNAGGITGWHLPSVGELMAVVKHRNTVAGSLKMLGAQDFSNEWYLTSTADGNSEETKFMYCYCVIMPEGRVVGELKTEKHKVRPFMIIR